MDCKAIKDFLFMYAIALTIVILAFDFSPLLSILYSIGIAFSLFWFYHKKGKGNRPKLRKDRNR